MQQKEHYIDIHTHRSGLSEAAIRNLFPEDCEKISDSGYFSVGLHPWYIDRENHPYQMEKVKKLADHHRVLAIGESGPDKLAEAPMDLQIRIFNDHIKIAGDKNKPLIIHAVKTYNEVVAVKKETGSAVPWIIHGFAGKKELADMLLQHGMFLSFGKALLNPEANANKIIGEMPMDRIFLETDDSDETIDIIYKKAAEVLNMEISELCRQMKNNFKRVFLRNDE